MKNLIAILTIALSATHFSQTSTPVWYNDISKASEISVVENKPMMLFFTGSDWCGWCMKLQREVFNTETFTTWSKECVVLVEIDFPKLKEQPDSIREQNNMLQKQFQIQGYPTVWFVSVTKLDDKYTIKPLDQTGYLKGGPSLWIETANSIINSDK